MTPGLRYLACLRLSADSDGSTSIEWQRGVIRHHVSSPHLSGVVVGEAEDTDVSGSMSPFKRPKLGRWLTAKADDFDVVIAARMDRLTRRSMHFNELLERAQENGKYIVCVEEGFDLSTPQGKMTARMTAVFAEAEWDTIQARILNGVQSRLENRSWLTGAPPTGYRIKTVEGGRRKVLEIDQHFHPYVEEIFTRVREGQSTHRIAREFNRRGVLTWGDHLRKLKGEETKGTQWQSTIINKFLRSSWVPGIYTYKGEAVLDDRGEPVILPEKPLASMEEWADLIDRIKPATKPVGVESRTGGKSLLAGIARCGNCGAPVTSLLNSGTPEKTVRGFPVTAITAARTNSRAAIALLVCTFAPMCSMHGSTARSVRASVRGRCANERVRGLLRSRNFRRPGRAWKSWKPTSWRGSTTGMVRKNRTGVCTRGCRRRRLFWPSGKRRGATRSSR